MPAHGRLRRHLLLRLRPLDLDCKSQEAAQADELDQGRPPGRCHEDREVGPTEEAHVHPLERRRRLVRGVGRVSRLRRCRDAGRASVGREPQAGGGGPGHATAKRIPAFLSGSVVLEQARRVSQSRPGRPSVVLELPVRQGRRAAVASRCSGDLSRRVRPEGQPIVRIRLPTQSH